MRTIEISGGMLPVGSKLVGKKGQPRKTQRCKMVHRLHLAPQGGGPYVNVTFTPSKRAEMCPITCEEIGCADTVVPYAPSELTPFKEYPSLMRASLGCGHAFHAPALLVHFMRNGLTCPMCRAGTNVLPTKASLPIRQEEWFRLAYDAIAQENDADEQAAIADDSATARALVLEQTSVMLQTLPADEFIRQLHMNDVSVTANVYFYRSGSDTPFPLLGMPLEMHVVAPAGSEEIQYRLYNEQLRALSRALNSLPNIGSLSVEIYARSIYASPNVESIPIANMHRTSLGDMETSHVTPIGNEINIEPGMDGDNGLVLRSFTYKPSLAAIVLLYCTNIGR